MRGSDVFRFAKPLVDMLIRARVLPPKPRRPSSEIGTRGELAARRHLESEGYRILATNAITPEGEADIVAEREDRGTFAIVEVKSRIRRADGSLFNAPERSVTARKSDRLAAIARHLARANDWPRVCVEIIAVEFDSKESQTPAALRHHRA